MFPNIMLLGKIIDNFLCDWLLPVKTYAIFLRHISFIEHGNFVVCLQYPCS